MASTYSTNLKIELMATGENSGTWGNVTNTNMGTALEQAIIGLGNPDFIADADLTITISNTNSSQAARCLVLNVTSVFGSLSATRELIVPTSQKQYIVQNNTAGGQSITVKTSAGTGITVPNGRKAHLYVDGTNVIQMFDFVDINGGAIDGTAIGGAAAAAAAFTSLTASGATTLNGAVALGDAAADLITVPGTVNSNLLFTDNTFDIGASGATRPRDLFLSRNLVVGGTLTLAGGVNLNGNVTVGDSSADTLTINSTITSNLIFTDNTYDIGASGATRPRNLFLAGNITAAGTQTLAGALTVDSTTDSTSTTTGSIQTDGGVGIAKALFVGTTVTAATLSLTNALGTASGGTGLGGATPFTANGVVYASSTSALATGSALTFDGTNLGVGDASPGYKLTVAGKISYNGAIGEGADNTLSSSGTTLILGESATWAALSLRTAGTERARFTGDGLEIKQSQLIGYSSYAGIGTNGLAVAGNVGVGTASPVVGGGKLQVVNSAGSLFFSGYDTTANKVGYAVTTSVGTPGQVNHYATYFGTGIDSYHAWYVTASSGAQTQALTLNTAGNLGLGVTPSDWSSASRPALQLPNGAAMFTRSGSTFLGQNFFYNNSDTGTYIANGFATIYNQASGQHKWFNAPSGTANNAAALTQAMTLDASGRLLVGATSAFATGTTITPTFLYSSTSGGVAAIFDRTTSDGDVVHFRRQGSTVGSIAVTATTTSLYGPSGTGATINSSGNVGIGTLSPGAKLDVASATGGVLRLTSTDTSIVAANELLGEVQMFASDASAGGTGVGAAISAFSESAFTGSGVPTYLSFSTAPAGGSVTERARIDSSGNLLIGTTNNYSVDAEKNVFVKNNYVFASDNTGSADNRNWRAGVNGYQNGSWQLTSSGANNTWPNDAYRFAVTRDGSCYNTTGTYGTLSDARFKDNVATARPYLEDLIKLRVVKYSLKSEQSNVATKLGLIAQEVEEVFPNMVDVGITVQGEEFKSVKMSVLVPMLLSAIQEQQTLIAALTARITALESSTLQ
jgi:hypothetical protein